LTANILVGDSMKRLRRLSVVASTSQGDLGFRRVTRRKVGDIHKQIYQNAKIRVPQQWWSPSHFLLIRAEVPSEPDGAYE
jgi:hypothetical protein